MQHTIFFAHDENLCQIDNCMYAFHLRMTMIYGFGYQKRYIMKIWQAEWINKKEKLLGYNWLATCNSHSQHKYNCPFFCSFLMSSQS